MPQRQCGHCDHLTQEAQQCARCEFRISCVSIWPYYLLGKTIDKGIFQGRPCQQADWADHRSLCHRGGTMLHWQRSIQQMRYINSMPVIKFLWLKNQQIRTVVKDCNMVFKNINRSTWTLSSTFNDRIHSSKLLSGHAFIDEAPRNHVVHTSIDECYSSQSSLGREWTASTFLSRRSFGPPCHSFPITRTGPGGVDENNTHRLWSWTCGHDRSPAIGNQYLVSL